MPTFRLEIVTPEGVLLDVPARSVRMPGVEGSFGVLAHHAPLMTALSVGPIKVEHQNGDIEFIAASGGFCQVQPGRVIVLADAAERSSDIDIARVEQAIAGARAHLEGGGSVVHADAQEALERAMNRLRVARMTEEQ